MSNIAKLFFDTAARCAGKTAISCDGTELTYAQLADSVRRMANYFISRGVEKNDLIGISMDNSIEGVAAIFAAAAVGAGLVPIDPTMPGAAARGVFAACGVKHIAAYSRFYARLCEGDVSFAGGFRLILDGSVPGADSVQQVSEQPNVLSAAPKLTGDEVLLVAMTSGSTGAPKPLHFTQKNKIERALAHIALFGITEDDVILATTPLYHTLAERLVIMPLITGATAVLMHSFAPHNWFSCVKRQHVTFTIAAAAQLNQIAQILSSPFVPEITELRAVVSSSATLEGFVRSELIRKLHCDFYEIYGTSETSTVTCINFKTEQDKCRSVGRAIPAAQLRIVDDTGTVLPPEKTGEIAVKTGLICSEYAANAGDGGFYRTGDMGSLDADGYLYFAGRKNDIIISGTLNVYPQDIENALSDMPEIAECAAFSYIDERNGECIAVAAVLHPGASAAPGGILAHCAQRLAAYQMPTKAFILPELPRNSMGKIIRGGIQQRLAAI